jgi:hypothetical protein
VVTKPDLDLEEMNGPLLGQHSCIKIHAHVFIDQQSDAVCDF